MRRLLFLLALVPAMALAQPRPQGGGIKISGSPAANQVTLWATGTSLKGDSNLAWDSTNKTLTILGTASSANALVIPSGSLICFDGACNNNIKFDSGTTSIATNTALRFSGTLSYFGSTFLANSDPVVTVHHTQTAANVSMEFGATAATANALAVTFATAFSAAPSCTCADINAAPTGCGQSVAAGTTGVTFKGTTGATDVISWICTGLK